MNLAGVDLNLLVALGALLEERNVTRAGARVGLSQPAMSNALARLRALVGDPLLVRAGRDAMAPTPRAQALEEPVRRILREAARALAPPAPFDPARSARAFTVVANDMVQLVLLPALLARWQAAAPAVTLVVRAPRRKLPFDELQTGAVDACVMPAALVDAPPGLRHAVLFEDRFACVERRARGAPARGTLSLAAFLARRHLLVAPGGAGTGPVDDALARLGRARTIAVRVPHFVTAAALVARSDLLATLPRALAHELAGRHGLRVLEPPLALPPVVSTLVWHDRAHQASDHQWFRAQLHAAAAAMSSGAGRSRGRAR